MAKLDEPVKAFIVERLACFARPSEVVADVKEEFDGLTITRQQVEEYDPAKRCKTEKWVKLHAATRASFLEQKAGIAISHRSWRQKEREDLYRAAKKARNYKLANELLQEAAKEEGDFYINARAGSGAGDLTDEQRAERIRAQLDAMDEVTAPPPPPSSKTPTRPALVKKSA
jgi:hypothetical protein